jgi:cytochrome c oxidase cbb3-type subunit 2
MTRRALYLLTLLLATRAGAVDSAALRSEGAVVYATHCAGCHGANGDGRGPAAEMLIVKPRDFTKGIFKFRSTPSAQLPTTDDLYRIISEGVYGTAMPAWNLLSERERYAVIEFIKTLYPGWLERGPGTPIYLPPPPAWLGSPQAVARGRELYQLLDCAKCHGESGRGDGPSAATLEPDIWGNAQRPFDFTKGRLRGGARIEDIYRTFMTGIGGTAMPSYAEIFDQPDGENIFPNDAWNLVSYVRSLRRPPQRPSFAPRKAPQP